METYIKTKKKTEPALIKAALPAKPTVQKRALIRKKFVNGKILTMVFLFSIAFIYLHVLLMQQLPWYVIVPVEILVFFLVWNRCYQVLYDLKLLFYFNSTYDSGEQFPEEQDHPAITFIIPSYHEPFRVAKMTYDSIIRAPYKGRKDIIMVDNSRNTDTEDYNRLKEYVETFALRHPEENVSSRFIYNPEQSKLKPGNLDLAWQYVGESEYIIILDVDSTLPAQGDLLEKAVAEFMADGKLGFLQFTIKATNNHFNDLTQSVAASQDLHRLRLVSRSYGGYKIFEGHNGMWRKSVLNIVGSWTDYYKGNIMITEDILKSAQVYANGYYGKSLNIPTGEWVPCSLDALQSMWMRWTYGTSQVLFKYYKEIYSGYVSLLEKFDITYHVLHHLVTGFIFPVAILLQLLVPGAAANLFLLAAYVLPQLIAGITIYYRSVGKLNLPVAKRISYLYSAFFLIDTFTMLTQLKSTFNFLAGIPQGWKVTAKGVESTSRWKDLLVSKSFHLGMALVAFAAAAFAWIRYYQADPRQLGVVSLLLFMNINLLLCIAIFGKDGQRVHNDVESAIIESTEATEIDMKELTLDVA